MSAQRPEGVSRFKHFRAWLGRQARGRRKDTFAILALALVGVVMMLAIFIQQNATLPAWIPFVGEEYEQISAEFSSAQAVTPGQGQAVDVAGVQIGKVTSVNLEDGHAVVGMDIEPKYMELLHPNATFLLRPKTGLNDMIVEIEPGSGKEQIDSGHRFGLDQTEPNVNLDAFLASLDADTRQYIQLLVAGGAQGIGGEGQSARLSNALRRFQPFVHYVAKLNKAIAARHVALSRVIHDFGELTGELSQHDAQIRQFVTSSDAALGNFANQQASIQDALERFPSALTPAFKSTTQLFKQTTAPIRDGIRPFTREIRPLLTHSAEAAGPFEKSVRNFGHAVGGLNSFMNQIAYKPKGGESGLFYLAWLNHNFNAAFNLQDGAGPILRATLLTSCTGADLGFGYVAIETAKGHKFLQTLLEMIGFPRQGEIPVNFKADEGRQEAPGTCAYTEK
jgi:phospholipid/cholesterol/gamma-HCH transport system substrate-binding protein